MYITKNAKQHIRGNGYCIVKGVEFSLSDECRDTLQQLKFCWNDLPKDEYLNCDHPYRYRRHDKFSYHPQNNSLIKQQHAPYLQKYNSNILYEKKERLFFPFTDEMINNSFLFKLIILNFSQFPISKKLLNRIWDIDVHFIRIIGSQKFQGHPSPEGIHRDGFKFIALHLINTENLAGGESQIYDNNLKILRSIFLRETLDTIYADDERVMHHATPIYSLNNEQAKRDMLLMSFDLENENGML